MAEGKSVGSSAAGRQWEQTDRHELSNGAQDEELSSCQAGFGHIGLWKF